MNQHFRDGLDKLGELVGWGALFVVGFLAVAKVSDAIRPTVQAFLACPIHVSTTTADGSPISNACLHLGLGQ